MASHMEIDDDSDHCVDTSKTSDRLMELEVIKGEDDDDDNENEIKNNNLSNSPTEIKHHHPTTNDVKKQQQGSTPVTNKLLKVDLIYESNGPILEVMKSQQHQQSTSSSSPMALTKFETVDEPPENEDETDVNDISPKPPDEIKHHHLTSSGTKKQQQGSTPVTNKLLKVDLISESNGPILEVMKSQQEQQSTLSSPHVMLTKFETVDEPPEDEDETDGNNDNNNNNSQITLRPQAERTSFTCVQLSTTTVRPGAERIYPTGVLSSTTTSEQEERPMEIIATPVTDDSLRMTSNNNEPAIIGVVEERKCFEIYLNLRKCPKRLMFVGSMLFLTLIIVIVLVLMNNPRHDEPSNLIDNDTDATPRPPSTLPTITPTISPTTTMFPTVDPTIAPGQILPMGEPIYGVSGGSYMGYVVTLSDDGQRVAVGSNSGTILGRTGKVQVYERNTDSDVWTPMGNSIMQPNMWATMKGSLSLSSNGDVVAIDADSPKSRFIVTYRFINGDWQPMGQRQMAALAVSLSSDGLHLAISDENYHAHVFSFDENVDDWVLRGSVVEGRSMMVSLSGDGKRLVVSDYEKNEYRGEVRMFELTTITTVDKDDVNFSNMTVVDDYDGDNMTYSNATVTTTAVELQPLGDIIMANNSEDRLGYEISTSNDGSIVAIGTNGGNYTRIIQYNATNNRWVTVDTIYGNAMDSNKFGYSISLSRSGQKIAIGAMGYINATGRSVVYEWDEHRGSYEQLGDDIVGSGTYQYEANSISIAGDGGYVAVGTPYSNNRDGVWNTGRVRVFKIW